MPAPDSTSSDPQAVIDELRRRLAAAEAERDEALAQQSASAEVLGVINASPGDLAPVFDAILEKAHSLCGVVDGTLFLRDGEYLKMVAARGDVPEAFAARLRQGVVAAELPASAPLLRGEPFVHIHDIALLDDPIARQRRDYWDTHPARRAAAQRQ